MGNPDPQAERYYAFGLFEVLRRLLGHLQGESAADRDVRTKLAEEQGRHRWDMDDVDVELAMFGPVRRVNVLIGANNAGKSLLARGLLKRGEALHCGLDRHSAHNMHWLPRDLLTIKSWIDSGNAAAEWGAVKSRLQDFLVAGERHAGAESKSRLAQAVSEWDLLLAKLGQHGPTDDAKNAIARTVRALQALKHCELETLKHTVFVPASRTQFDLKTAPGVDPLAAHYATTFKVKTENVFTGQSLYQQIFNHRNGRSELRERIEAFTQWCSISFFGGRELDLVSQADPRELLVRIGRRDERPLRELGDGIQFVLMLAWPLFAAEKGSWIFIDEPELGLHPALQRAFLEVCRHKSAASDSGLTVFLTTHSNHFLEVAEEVSDDVSIFTFEARDTHDPPPRDRVFVVRHLDNDRRAALDLLGVHNASVLMANCTLWVEGPSEVAHLRGYLRAFFEHERNGPSPPERTPLEDRAYAFVVYGGSLVANLVFSDEPFEKADVQKVHAMFIANRVLLLADRDADKGKKAARQADFERLATTSPHFAFVRTPGRELENMLSDDLIRREGEALFGAKAEWSKLSTLDPTLPLGQQLDDDLGTALAAESGTLRSDVKARAARWIHDHVVWTDMRPEAQELVRRVVAFVKRHNQ